MSEKRNPTAGEHLLIPSFPHSLLPSFPGEAERGMDE